MDGKPHPQGLCLRHDDAQERGQIGLKVAVRQGCETFDARQQIRPRKPFGATGEPCDDIRL